ncbi:MAG TPA: hypothetical protein VD969_12260 [Symbiobacteriaceae bacterium]|nr:hypothetical protein [Symbiobacteriaceae bacterium]
MNRLSKDTRFTLEFDYQGDFIPNACKVTLLTDDVTLKEVADLMYAVAQHGVTYEGAYLAGSEADRERHRK